MDESTDISVSSNMVVYVYFLEGGELQVEFLELAKLKGGKAVDVVAGLIDVLSTKERGNLVDKLVTLGTDGCSTMMGAKGGVGKLLREKCPFLLQFHCMAHKLMLAVAAAFDDDEVYEVDRLLSAIYGQFKYSSKKRERLDEIHAELSARAGDEVKAKLRSIKRHVRTRWLSRGESIQSVLDCLEEAVTFILDEMSLKADDVDGDSGFTAAGKKSAMKPPELKGKVLEFKVIALLHFLGDVTELLNIVSKTLQKTKPDLLEVFDAIEGLIASFETNYPPTGKIKWGPRMRAFLERSEVDVGSESPGPIPITSTHKIMFTKSDVVELYTIVRDCSERLVDQLRDRMPDADVIRAMLIFDARRLPLPEASGGKQPVLPQDYGDGEIEALINWFAPDGKPAYIDADELRAEWLLFKGGCLVRSRGMSYHGMYRMLSTGDQFPNITKLLAVAVLFPIANAVCERGFSTQNLIKSKLTNRLGKHLDPKMRVCELGPEPGSKDATAVTKRRRV